MRIALFNAIVLAAATIMTKESVSAAFLTQTNDLESMLTQADSTAESEDMMKSVIKTAKKTAGQHSDVLNGPTIGALLAGYDPMKTAIGQKTGYGRAHAVDTNSCGACNQKKCPLVKRDVYHSVHQNHRRIPKRDSHNRPNY